MPPADTPSGPDLHRSGPVQSAATTAHVPAACSIIVDRRANSHGATYKSESLSRSREGAHWQLFRAEGQLAALPVDLDLPNALEVDNATFRWGIAPGSTVKEATHEAFQLRNLSLTVPRGKLVGVVGTVGSGKSSLLSGVSYHGQTSERTLKGRSSVRCDCCKEASDSEVDWPIVSKRVIESTRL